MPIDQLPLEVLTLIFDLVCSQNLLQEYQYDGTELMPHEPSTTLSSPVIAYLPALAASAVCVRWRALCLVLPGLWARLKLEIVEIATASNGFMATLQLYLERSAETPLYLDILIGYTGELDEGVNPPALDLLLKHTSRWKTVRCATDRKLSQEPLFLPMLETLAIEWPWAEWPMQTLQCFETITEIHMLTINEAGYSHDWHTLRRHALTYLNIFISLEYEDIDMLRDLPNLTVLKLGVLGWESVGNLLPRPFPQVKSFTLQLDPEERSKDYMTNVLDAFILPSLNELIVCRGDRYSGQLTWPVRAFSEFLSRSSCTLIHLSVRGIAISDVEFIAALWLVPSLTSLEFDDYHRKEKKLQMERARWKEKFYGFRIKSPITSFFLSNLTVRDSNIGSRAVLVPKLQSLSIKTKSNLSYDSFVRMVLSRWLPDSSNGVTSGVASLRSLVLRLQKQTVDEEVFRPLFELDKVAMRWGREVKEEADLRPMGNSERMGMRVVITGKEYSDLE